MRQTFVYLINILTPITLLWPNEAEREQMMFVLIRGNLPLYDKLKESWTLCGVAVNPDE